MDVGCGDGLLVQRLAAVCHHVTGVDSDRTALSRARERTTDLPNVTLRHGDFLALDEGLFGFDVVTMVAVLHHLDPRVALSRGKELLRPGGELLVVGLSVNRPLGDRLLSGMALPLVRAMSRLHHERREIGVVVAEPTLRLTEIRSVAMTILPGVRIRRGLYYRYLLRWSKPS